MIFWSSFIINWKWDLDSFLNSAIFFGKPHLCSAQFPFGYLHSSVVTSYKAGRLDVVPHAVLQIFCQFQSRVGKILIMAININVVSVSQLTRQGWARSGWMLHSLSSPDFLCRAWSDHDTLSIFTAPKNAQHAYIHQSALKSLINDSCFTWILLQSMMQF